MLLEPVTFRYKESVANGSQNRQYGLIAEQVAAIYPELAVYGKDGQVETLQYQQLPAMLLNEIQKQHKTIDDLQARIAELEKLVKANAAALSTVAGH
jgi:transposase